MWVNIAKRLKRGCTYLYVVGIDIIRALVVLSREKLHPTVVI